MGVSEINNRSVTVESDASVNNDQVSSLGKLEKAAAINRFLIIDSDSSQYVVRGKQTANNQPLDYPEEDSFSEKRLGDASDDLGGKDFSNTGFDISQIALTLLHMYYEERDDAQKLQKEEEENVVQKIKDQAGDMKTAAWQSLAASLVESGGSAVMGLCHLGGLSGKKGKIWSKAIVGTVKTVFKSGSAFSEYSAKLTEAQEKTDEAEEKLHEHKAEEAKRHYSNMHEAIQQTIQIMIETSKAQQETQKEIARRV